MYIAEVGESRAWMRPPSSVESFLDGFCLSVFTVWFLSLGVHAAVLWKFSRLCSNIFYTHLNNPFLNIAF